MRKALLALVVGLGMTWAAPASADVINFDPTGSGSFSVLLDRFDWSPGNSLLVEGITGGVPDGTGTIYLMSNLNSAQLGGGSTFVNGTGGHFFTAVAQLSVHFTSGTTYTIDPGVGAFGIYATSALGNDITGTGFTSGTLIAVGTSLVPNAGTGSTNTIPGSYADAPFSADCTATGAARNCLDQFDGGAGTNNKVGIYSLTATGGTNANVRVTDFNHNYFGNLIAGTTIGINTTNNNLAFFNANPAAAFSTLATGGTIGTTVAGNGNVLGASLANVALCGNAAGGGINGICINGTGSNIVTETDLSTRFQNVAAIVPEPATMTLLGLGLLAGARRRRQNKK